MSKQQTRRTPQKRRPQQRKGRTAVAARATAKGRNRTTWILVAIVVAIGGALVFVLASSSNKKSNKAIGTEVAPSALVSKVTGVSDTVINDVGAGAASLPQKVKEVVPPLVTKDGKPRVVYIGAEYCPYCATERWAMVQALSRFGTFKNLQITTSGAAPEAFPNTSTFSFHGATYSSKYIQFEAVEEQTNKGAALDTPTSEQGALMAKYDVAPYTTRDGAIPFVDFANQYIVSGASYNAGVLSGLTHDEIASALADPSSDIAKGAIGTANGMTAAICKLTKNQPSAVCSQPAVKALAQKL